MTAVAPGSHTHSVKLPIYLVAMASGNTYKVQSKETPSFCMGNGTPLFAFDLNDMEPIVLNGRLIEAYEQITEEDL